MRSISFGLAVGFLLMACGGEEAKPQPEVPATPAMTPPAPATTAEAPKEEPKLSLAELQKKTLTGYGEAMNAHDAKKVAALYTETAVVNVAGTPGEAKGRDAIAAQYQHLFDAFATFKSAPSRIWMKGDAVIVEWGFTGTHSGDLHGIKATEKPVGTMGVDVIWFSPEGQIKEQHTYYDMGTMMSQIGLSKQKARGVPTLAATPVVAVSNGTADETKNVEAATKMWAAFDTKSEADFLGGTADDVTWDDMTQPEASKGKAAGKKFFNAMTKAFPDAKSTSTHAWGVADFVISEGTFSGTHKGALFGIQPTKKSVNMHGVDIMQFKDGKVIKGWSYGNSAEMMSQLGLMPQPGAAKGDKPAAKAAPAGKSDAKPAAPAAPKPAAPAAPKK
jgi:steroid delta-isomerase-like uncharacterized protein